MTTPQNANRKRTYCSYGRLPLFCIVLLSLLSLAKSLIHISATSVKSSSAGAWHLVQLSQAPRQKRSALFMGKGDGKKKRKKKPATSAAAPAPSPELHIQPMRVTSDSNVSVKRQIRYAQLNKEYAKQRANPGFRQKKVVRTKYRRTWGRHSLFSFL